MGKTGGETFLPPVPFSILNRVTVKRAQEARDNQFFFESVQNNEIFEIIKIFKNNRWTIAYYTKSKCLLFIGLIVLLLNVFWVNLVQKLKILSLSLNLVFRLIWICKIPWWCSLFLFLTRNTFFGKFCPKNQNCQFELKFGTTHVLIWICRIQW